MSKFDCDKAPAASPPPPWPADKVYYCFMIPRTGIYIYI